jgi:hypothetical protein
MQNRRLSVLFGSFLAVSCVLSGTSALAATPFAITATNVTMPSTGNGSSQYTVTGIPGTGTMAFGCQYSGTATEAKIPICPMTPPVLYQVVAGQTLTGTVSFYPYGVAIPAALRKAPHRSGHLPAAGLALAGALLLGFGFPRRASRWLVLSILAVGAFAGLVGISTCGGSGNGMTPGTYPYIISAQWESSGPAILGNQTTTTITVTVP